MDLEVNLLQAVNNFTRTFFISSMAISREEDSAKMIRSAAQLRGMQALDV